MTAGRPPKFKTAEALQDKADEYFDMCKDDEKPYTVSGLCYHLGFADKCSFTDYEKRPKFSYTIKRLRLRIEQSKNEMLLIRGNPIPGVIFDLKNNHGWSDKHDTEETTEEAQPIKIEIISQDARIRNDK